MKVVVALAALGVAGCASFPSVWSDDPAIRACARQSITDANVGALVPGVQYYFYRKCLAESPKADPAWTD